MDSAGIATFVNPSMAKMLGYTVEEVVGSSFFNFMDEEGLEKAKLLFKNDRKGEIKNMILSLYAVTAGRSIRLLQHHHLSIQKENLQEFWLS